MQVNSVRPAFFSSRGISYEDLIQGELNKLVTNLNYHKTEVYLLTISRNGGLLVSVSIDDTIAIWDFNTRKQLQVFSKLTESKISCVHISDNADTILVGCEKGLLYKLQAPKFDAVEIQNKSTRVSSIAIDHSSTLYAASWSSDYTIFLFNSDDSEKVSLKGHTGSINSILFSNDNRLIASGSSDKSILLWRLADYQLEKKIELHNSAVITLAFSKNLNQLFSISEDKTINCYYLDTNIHISKSMELTINHKTEVVQNIFLISPNDKYLIFISDSQVKVFNLEQHRLSNIMLSPSRSIKSMALSNDGEVLVVGLSSGEINLINVDQHKEDSIYSFTFGVMSIAVSKSQRYLAVGASTNNNNQGFEVKLMDLKTYEEIKLFNDGHYIYWLLFDQNETSVISASGNGSIRVTNIANKSSYMVYEDSGCSVRCLAEIPGSTTGVCGTSSNKVLMWNTKEGEKAEELYQHEGEVLSVCISSENKYLLSCSKDTLIKVFNLKLKSTEFILKGHSKSVYSVLISKDTSFIVSSSEDKTVKIWNFQERLEKYSYEEHTSTVRCIALSRDNKYIFSGSSDSTIKVWKISSQKLIHSYNLHRGQVNSICCSPDGELLYSGAADKTVRTWKIGKRIKFIEIETPAYEELSVFCQATQSVFFISGKKLVKEWKINENVMVQRVSPEKLIYAITVSSDGKYLAISIKSEIQIFNVETGVIKTSVPLVNTTAYALDISQDIDYLLIGSEDSLVQVCCKPLTSPINLIKLLAHNKPINSVAISSKHKYAVSGASDCKIAIWKIDSVNIPFAVLDHKTSVGKLQVTLDEEKVIAATKDGLITIWSISDKVRIFTFSCGDEQYNSFCVDTTGKLIVSKFRKGNLKIWDLDSRKDITTIAAFEDSITSVFITENLSSIIACSKSGFKAFDLSSLRRRLFGLNADTTDLTTLNQFELEKVSTSDMKFEIDYYGNQMINLIRKDCTHPSEKLKFLSPNSFFDYHLQNPLNFLNTLEALKSNSFLKFSKTKKL